MPEADAYRINNDVSRARARTRDQGKMNESARTKTPDAPETPDMPEADAARRSPRSAPELGHQTARAAIRGPPTTTSSAGIKRKRPQDAASRHPTEFLV